MKKMKRILTLILSLGVLLALAIPALAEEATTDWGKVDWANWTWDNWDDSQWNSLQEWLLADAPYKDLFLIATKTDGWISESMNGVLYTRFCQEPKAFIRALAAESREVEDRTIQDVVQEAFFQKEEFALFMSQLVLDEDATTAEKSILVRMVQCAEENYNMSITNPHTGDPVGVVVALLAVSGAGLAVMLPKKKKIT